MTTTTTTTSSGSATSSRTTRIAVVGIAASAVVTAVGTFWDLTDNESGSNHSWDEYVVVLGMIAVVAALAYGLGVRGAAAGSASRRSAVLGALAAVSIVLFWSGAPLVLASASLACALVDRDRLGSFGTGSRAGLALSALTTIAALTLAVVG